MTAAGADVVVAHMGLTTAGTIGAQTAVSLDDAVARVQAIRDAAIAVRPDVLVLCHGGPIAEPVDAAYVLSRTRGVQGFFGASSSMVFPFPLASGNRVLVTDSPRLQWRGCRRRGLSKVPRKNSAVSRSGLEGCTTRLCTPLCLLSRITLVDITSAPCLPRASPLPTYRATHPPG